MSDASNIKLANQAIAREAWVCGDWTIQFGYALPGRLYKYNYAIKGKNAWLDIPVCDVSIDQLKLSKLAEASVEDKAGIFASHAVLDLLQQCSDNKLKEQTNPSYLPSRGEHRLILTARRDGVEVRLLTSVQVLLCLNRLWRDEAVNCSRNDDSLKELAISIEILHKWLNVTLTELGSWTVGDFLAICPTNELERTGIKLETVDRHGFAFAELSYSGTQTRVTRIIAHHLRPQTAQSQFNSFENKTASNFLTLMKDDNMPDTDQTLPISDSAMSSRPSKKREGNANPLRVSFPVSLHLGTLRMTLAEIESLKPGQVIDFQANTSSDVSVYVGDNKVALGTLCEINGNFGIMLRQLLI